MRPKPTPQTPPPPPPFQAIGTVAARIVERVVAKAKTRDAA